MFRELDLKILYYLNVEWQHPVLDQFWRTVTQLHKIPLVLYIAGPLLLGLLIFHMRKHSIQVIAALVLAIGIADLFSYRVIKSAVHRPRPFETEMWVRKVGIAHGPSFPSNHTANCFAAAAVLSWFFQRRRRLFYAFAALVAVSRVALGVHYPSDVLAGAIIGQFIGFLLIVLVLNRVQWFWPPELVSKPLGDFWTWRKKSRRISGD